MNDANRGDSLDRGSVPKVAFITEQHVGLRTYSENLRAFADLDDRIVAEWVPVTYDDGSVWAKVPFLPPSIKGALCGRAQVRRAIRRTRPDACLYLTQTPAALGGALVRRDPYVVICDDTPILFDGMAEHYDISTDENSLVRRLKHRINVRALRGAATLLPMSEWAARSLVEDYGVHSNRVQVLPTGVDIEAWRRPGVDDFEEDRSAGPFRILFVGGDFVRKGGEILLSAFSQLGPTEYELHLVTRSDVSERTGIRVYNDLGANSRALRELFWSCDAFVLPSLGEAFPNVIVEACASGLPCVVADVGGMAEMIVDGESGFVMKSHASDELAELLSVLNADRGRCRTMGLAARSRAEGQYDGERNASRVVDVILRALQL